MQSRGSIASTRKSVRSGRETRAVDGMAFISNARGPSISHRTTTVTRDYQELCALSGQESSREVPLPQGSRASSPWWGLRADKVTLVLVVLFAYWWVVKHHLFQGLEYTSDLFLFLQASNSWMHGRPLLFENQHGVITGSHNYYTILAFGPLTKLFGAYGLFAGFLLLLFLAARSSLLYLDPGVSGWTHARIVFGSLMLGPVGFWFWDHPVYGFHLELLFLPLGILYTLSLIDGSRWRWLWLALICLTREEGPLFAWSIHVLVWWLRRERSHSAGGGQWKGFFVPLARMSLGYLVLFGAELALILAHRGIGSARLGEATGALETMFDQGILGQYVSLNLLLCGTLVAPVVIVSLYGGRVRATVFGLGLALAPVLAVQGIAGLIYLDVMHGITWEPRFVLIWTIGLAGILVKATHQEAPAMVKLKKWHMVAAVLCLLCYQGFALWLVRGYPVWQRVSAVSTQGLLLDRLTKEEVRFLDCLAARLPEETHVAASGEVFGKFHRQMIVWPNRTEYAWQAPEIVVCDEGQRLDHEYFRYDCDQLLTSTIDQGLKEAAVGQFRVSYTPQVERVLEACLVARTSTP